MRNANKITILLMVMIMLSTPLSYAETATTNSNASGTNQTNVTVVDNSRWCIVGNTVNEDGKQFVIKGLVMRNGKEVCNAEVFDGNKKTTFYFSQDGMYKSISTSILPTVTVNPTVTTTVNPTATETVTTTPVTMDENSMNELNRLTRTGRHYVLISIKDFSFVPKIMEVKKEDVVFIYNEDPITHYIKFSDNNNGYFDIPPGTILGFCCGDNPAGTMVEYQSRDYISMKGKTLVAIDTVNPTVTVTATVNPTVTTTTNPTATTTTNPTATVTATATNPTVTATATVSPTSAQTDKGPGCWSSYDGFGQCVGSAAAKTGIGILKGIGRVIGNLF